MKVVPTIVGLVFIGIAIISFVYQGINYSKEEQVLKIGDMQVTAERHESIPLPPIAGGIALAAGIILLYIGRKK